MITNSQSTPPITPESLPQPLLNQSQPLLLPLVCIPKALPNCNKHFQTWSIKQKLIACKLRTLDQKIIEEGWVGCQKVLTMLKFIPTALYQYVHNKKAEQTLQIDQKGKNVYLPKVENKSNQPRFILQSGWYFQETFLSLKIRGL